MTRPWRRAPSEQDICNEFGVSKTASREITAALVAKWLIRVSHGRRPSVLPPESWNLFDPLILEVLDNPDAIDELVAEMHEIRTLLEPDIAAWAAQTRTDEQLAALNAAMKMEEELRRPSQRFEPDVEFHLILARATGNRILVQIMESLRDLMRVSVRRRTEHFGENLRRGRRSPDDHHRIIYDALFARFEGGARSDAGAHARRSHDARR